MITIVIFLPLTVCLLSLEKDETTSSNNASFRLRIMQLMFLITTQQP